MTDQLAMGLSASSDASNHKVGDMFDEYPNLHLARDIDDLMVHCTDMKQLDSQTGAPTSDLQGTSSDIKSSQVPVSR